MWQCLGQIAVNVLRKVSEAKETKEGYRLCSEMETKKKEIENSTKKQRK